MCDKGNFHLRESNMEPVAKLLLSTDIFQDIVQSITARIYDFSAPSHQNIALQYRHS